MKAQLLLALNIRTLLKARGAKDADLAFYCGHGRAWISKVLAGQREVAYGDLDKVADFFGLTLADLFSYGISPKLERRKATRRAGSDRRTGQDRRQPSNVQRFYGELLTPFPRRREEDDDGGSS